LDPPKQAPWFCSGPPLRLAPLACVTAQNKTRSSVFSSIYRKNVTPTWRQSPHDTPQFTAAEVLTLALWQGCLGVASLKQTHRLVAHNYRSAFPPLCSDPPWVARLQDLTAQISALLITTAQISARSPAFYRIDAKPSRMG
jgi:hypothetical protein